MTRSPIHRSALAGFSAQAESYARGRPDYPAQVVEWLRAELGLRAGATVCDLGAGTGKFQASLAATGAHVVAVEPVAAMRAELVARHPHVVALDGTAAHLPLDDATLDAVVCAQSFHWFATAEALAEIARVLKPGGALGLVWNRRDARTPWVAAIQDIMEPYRGDTPSHESMAWRRVFPARGFGPLSEQTFDHAHRGDPETVIVDRMRSVSFIAELPDAEQEAVTAAIRAVIAESPELSGREDVTFPYRTACYRCFKAR